MVYFSNSTRARFDDDESKVVLDRDFILDCLCWHNEYRARHDSPALTISNELCEKAQRWAEKLAASNEFYYKTNEKTLGQNLFCCPANNVLTDLTGQEVASYWYKEVKKYDFFKETSLLHTNVNTGHFTQMIWCGSRYFGVGKAFSKTGKMFVVAFYFPCGNVVNKFQFNVLPPACENNNNSENNNNK
uniref:CSON009938 protein n=1 Tax=Culicoides sonorensis TaxID=179676 RepID=A0A336LXW0_CULSO